jgi:tetratricopeptide (TPR) repeat protein
LDRRFSLLTGGQRTALPHHQTLLAAIEWSYDLLSDPEQVLFRRLSIFADSFTLEAAEDICAGEAIRDDQVLTLLARLVDKSLLQVDPGLQDPELATRYRFLDTIRSLGRLKLEEADESRSMSNRHAAYYLRLAETAAPELLMQNQAAWYKLLQAETGNIRAVIDWSMESDQAESALRIMGAMLWFWWSHGSVHEGIDLAYKALALPSAARFKTYRARTLNLVGILHWALGELHLAHQLLEEAESILRASDDKVGLTWSLQFLGMVLTSEGEYGLADAAMQESIAIAGQLGDLSKSSFSLAFVGDIPLQQGDRTHAQRVYRECADMLHSMGNKLFAAYPTRRLGYLALEDGDLQHTRPLFWESLMLNREGNDRRGVAASQTSLAALAQRLGKPVLAARLMGVVESQLESLSLNLLYLDQVELSSLRSQMLTHLGQAAFTTAFFEGWGMSEARVMELAGEV